ncbi:MAG TPA: CHASE2 domain-containing protein [Rhizomicrobium sp.]|nr:CHASE2 domain-containing protein [Rhizomicrobium sp.]
MSAIGGLYSRARRPDRGHMEALSKRVPYWFLVVSLVAFASFQIWMNPFGFSDLVQRYSQDVADLLITGPYLYGTDGRDQVSVAVIDDDTLHTLQAPWPWKYGDHARALAALRAYQPKAVIVDFLFVDSRPDDTLPDLVEEIRRYRAAHIPLYFEGGINLPFGEAALRPELAATGVPILDPGIPTNGGVARQYNVTGRCFDVKPDADGACPSLALHVYRDVYPEHPLVHVDGLMELVWGTRTAPENLKWMHPKDADGNLQSCETESGLLRRWYLAFFDTNAIKSPCPYNAQIPVEALLEGADDADVTRLATDRVIFYGGALQGAQDRWYTPVNGLIPGVFVHAMALDNLITFKGRPYQNTVAIAGKVIDGNLVQILAVVPVILILCWFHWRSLRRKRADMERSATFEYFFEKAVEKVWHYFAFALALGAGLALTVACGLSLANWVEVVFVSTELGALLLVGAPDSFWGYLHHVAGGEIR